MTSGNDGFMISRLAVAALTDGLSTVFEQAACEVIGRNVHLGQLADLVDTIPRRVSWNLTDWKATHAELRPHVAQLILMLDAGSDVDLSEDAEAAETVDEIFSAIATDVLLTYWQEMSEALIENTLTKKGRKRYRPYNSAQQFKKLDKVVAPDQYVALYIVNTQDEDCDFSDSCCERNGAWAVVDPQRYTPAAEALKQFISQEWWATGIHD